MHLKQKVGIVTLIKEEEEDASKWMQL